MGINFFISSNYFLLLKKKTINMLQPFDAHIYRIGSSVEWKVLYKLAKDKNGLLQKETIRGVYDGSLFEQLKKQKSADKKK